jgi:hypothetical protein
MGHIIGIDPTASFTATEMEQTRKGFGLGDRGFTADGNEYVFVLAGSGGFTGAGYVGIIDEAYGAVMASTTTSATAFGDMVGVAGAAVAASSYCWLCVKGVVGVRGNAAAAANARLNTTGTAGQVDDDGTAGAEVVNNMVFTTVVGGAAAVQAAVINYPSIGVTI